MLSATAIRSTHLPSGEAVPVLGQGTWGLAEGKHERDQEIKALRLGLELGMSLIDTAEMLLHWRGSIPLQDTLEGTNRLTRF